MASPSLEFAAMDSLQRDVRKKPLELGDVVEVTVGPLRGIRGVLLAIAEDGRATIELSAPADGIRLIADATSIASV
jgi:transcription antitermination factor NusG